MKDTNTKSSIEETLTQYDNLQKLRIPLAGLIGKPEILGGAGRKVAEDAYQYLNNLSDDHILSEKESDLADKLGQYNQCKETAIEGFKKSRQEGFVVGGISGVALGLVAGLVVSMLLGPIAGIMIGALVGVYSSVPIGSTYMSAIGSRHYGDAKEFEKTNELSVEQMQSLLEPISAPSKAADILASENLAPLANLEGSSKKISEKEAAENLARVTGGKGLEKADQVVTPTASGTGPSEENTKTVRT